MALILISTPATGVLTAFNRLDFEFLAGASEVWMQLKIVDQDAVTIVETKATPFQAGGRQTIDVAPYLRSYLQANGFLNDNSNNALSPSPGGVTEIDLSFTLEYKTDVTGTYTSFGISYNYWLAVRNIVDEFQGVKVISPSPNLTEFNATEGTGGTVTAQGKYLTKLSRRKLYYYSPVANVTGSADIVVFQQQNVYYLEAPFTDIDFEVTFFLNGNPQISQSNPAAGSFQAGYHPTWLTGNVWQYDYLIVEITSNTGNPVPDTIMSTRFDIVRLCGNFVVVKYLNAFGCLETFSFDGRTPRSNDFETTDEYGKYPSDLSTATSTGRKLQTRQFPELSVFKDQLTLEEAKAIEDLFTSPLVLLYVGDLTPGADADEWVEVVVADGSIEGYDTYDTKHSVSATLKLNERYTLSN